jgi:chromosome segregation ATPase
MGESKIYVARVVFKAFDATPFVEEEAASRLRQCIETHPTLGCRIAGITVVDESTEQLRDDRQVERLEQTIQHLSAKLKTSEDNEEKNKRALRELKTRYEDVVMQLEKIAQHKGAMIAREMSSAPPVSALVGDLSTLIGDLKTLEAKRQELENRVSFLDGVRVEHGARFAEMRERIWLLENNISPEKVALESERDFWRAKALALMKKG